MPDTATEEKKTESEVPKGEPAPTEAQPKPDEAAKKEPEDAADNILHSEPGDAAAPKAEAAPAATGAVATDDEGWKQLQESARRQGVSPQQLVQYASAGYQAERAVQQKPTPEPSPKPSAPELEDEELEPVSRREFKAHAEAMEKRTAVAIAGARNDAKLEALLNTQPLTRDEPEARATIGRTTYELMAAGAPMEAAFGEASRRHGDYLARVGRRSAKKKIAAQAALGESGAAESAPILPPEFKPDADNIRSGKTVERALALVEGRRLSGE